MSNEVRTQTPNLKGFLEKHVGLLQEVATKTITPERMVRLVCAAASRQPELAECDPISILRSMVQAAEHGLEVCSGANEAYLVPFFNSKTKKKEAQYIPGYQGLAKLAIESGKVRNIEARVVRAKDAFDYELGLTPTIKHKPSMDEDPGKVVAVYAIAFLPDGGHQFDVMSRAEVEAIQARSKAAGFGPWKTDWNEMAKKTVVRRLYKYLPKLTQMAAALEAQATAESGDYIDASDVTTRPGDAPVEVYEPPTLNEDGDRVYTWSEEEKQDFHTACDTLQDLSQKAGELPSECDARIRHYRDQRDAAIESPDTVLNRMVASAEKLQKKLIEVEKVS